MWFDVFASHIVTVHVKESFLNMLCKIMVCKLVTNLLKGIGNSGSLSKSPAYMCCM